MGKKARKDREERRDSFAAKRIKQIQRSSMLYFWIYHNDGSHVFTNFIFYLLVEVCTSILNNGSKFLKICTNRALIIQVLEKYAHNFA